MKSCRWNHFLQLSVHIGPEKTREFKDKKPDVTPKPRTVVCRLYNWKEREAILKAARRIKPHGIYIDEDLAEETMASEENFFQN